MSCSSIIVYVYVGARSHEKSEHLSPAATQLWKAPRFAAGNADCRKWKCILCCCIFPPMLKHCGLFREFCCCRPLWIISRSKSTRMWPNGFFFYYYYYLSCISENFLFIFIYFFISQFKQTSVSSISLWMAHVGWRCKIRLSRKFWQSAWAASFRWLAKFFQIE